MPEISILVPIYNVEKYLRQCIDSIVGQSFGDLEIILINDGSTDSSLEIMEEYASKDPRITIIDKKNSGYGASMNQGLDKATGKYLGIVESDDWVEKDMFGYLHGMCEKHSLDVARSEFFRHRTIGGVSDEPTVTDYVPHDKVFSPREVTETFEQQPSIWANLYRREFLVRNGIRFLETPGASYQDTAFSFKVYACSERFMMTSKPFYHYRIDGGSSSFQNTTKVYCVCDEYAEIWRYVKDNGLYDSYRHLIPRLQLNGYRWNFERLAVPYCNEFFTRWHGEFTALHENGDIDMDSFGTGERRRMLKAVLDNDPPLRSNRPLVSVVVPVYNVEKYLGRCLDSIVNQSLKDIEIICVNDGSPDNSLDILKRYQRDDPRIKIIDKKNGGLSSARNAGIDAATADFIGFVDSDDWIEPDTYETALKHIGDCDYVVFGTTVTGDFLMERRQGDNEYYRVKYSGEVVLDDKIRLNTDVSAWNKLYRTESIRRNGIRFPEGKLYEDYEFYWKYSFNSSKAYFIQDRKYNYFRRDDSILAGTFKGSKRAIEHMEVFEDIFTYVQKKDGWKDRQSTLNSMFLNCFWFAYLNTVPEDRKRVRRKGTSQVVRFNLTGDPAIEKLRNKDYGNLGPVETRPDDRFSVKLMNLTGKIFGLDMRSFRSLFSDDPLPENNTRSVARTRWVRNHENRYGMRRWNRVYDSNDNWEGLNWGMKEGIVGGAARISTYVTKHMEAQGEYRVLFEYDGRVSQYVETVLTDNRESGCGTSVYDGRSAVILGAMFRHDTGEVQVYAFDTIDRCDVSDRCRVVTIHRRD